MKTRRVIFEPATGLDIGDIWTLVASKNGAGRADKVEAMIEAFCRSLATVPEIGTRHFDRYPGLRSCGVPGLKRCVVLFIVRAEVVTVVRIGYLGKNVWSGFPHSLAEPR